MNKKQLLDSLNTLHTELSKAEHVDAEALAMLDTLTSDIQRVSAQSVESSEDAPEPVVSGLNSLLLEFRDKHPQVSSIIEQVTDGLAQLGI